MFSTLYGFSSGTCFYSDSFCMYAVETMFNCCANTEEKTINNIKQQNDNIWKLNSGVLGHT